jgi:hypothetical protein
MSTLTITDRLRRWSYLQDVSLWLDPMPGSRRREILRDLRANLGDAALDVGMDRAIEDLGRPRALAREYLQAEPRNRPVWAAGVVAAGAVLLVGMLGWLTYAFGMADALMSVGGGTAEGGYLGLRVVTEAGPAVLGFETSGWSWPLTTAVLLALLLGARAWRLLARRPG